ncbi:MAG: CDP-diacylglycerol--glycerol-3-phosphate 3-phosphatidyltransferase [Phycisphaerae bacterium]
MPLMRMNLPNQITVARLFIAVVFCCLLACFDCRQIARDAWILDLALGLFIVGAVSDILDGYLARRQNQVTNLGRVLDPFVDKILVSGGFILFLGTGFVNEQGRNITDLRAWMVVAIVSRELLISGLRGFSESSGRSYGANAWGKAKMVVQSVTVGWVLASIGRGREIDWFVAARPFVIWFALIITALSVGGYLSASRAALAERPRE